MRATPLRWLSRSEATYRSPSGSRPRRYAAIALGVALTLGGAAMPAIATTSVGVIASRSVLVTRTGPTGIEVDAIAFRLTAPVRVDADPATVSVVRSAVPVQVVAVQSAARAELGPVATGRWLIAVVEPIPGFGTEPGAVWAAGIETAITTGSGSTIAPRAEFVPRSTVNPVADRFIAGRQSGPHGLRYRLFRPSAYLADRDSRRRYPLVLALHGAGESGADNSVQLQANQLATSFADPSWQAEHPSFVLAPQLLEWDGGLGWTDTEVESALRRLIDRTSRLYPIDPDRVYVTGLSIGSQGGWDLLSRYPRTFAAALLVSYGGNPVTVQSLKRVPIWNIQGVGDDVISYQTSLLAARGLRYAGVDVVSATRAGDLPLSDAMSVTRAHWDRAKARGAHVLFTAFRRGTVGVPGQPTIGDHFAWVDVYLNPVYLEWLYAQRRP